MSRSLKRTTRLRVVLALVFAFVLPGLLLGEAYYLLDPSVGREETGPGFAVIGVVFGFFLGWPFVLGAAVAWSILDSLERHFAWTAALVGVLTGLAVSAYAFRNGMFQTQPVAYPLCAAIGLATGLGVWWIAYGRQSRLPVKLAPKTRLVL
ncbi:hypothetical protein OVA11_15415 [Caulobacter sp. SL161]|uniref:hypothetical protein n=1 Tax=Caulobacter sp. SL161 TaxID=2995156 RepID=UPI00227519AA|nr:hypothetical protein [Caulobacter sp. SL161]MCY1648401.1 hypothetical protein [Caulobacter sp. SL161]